MAYRLDVMGYSRDTEWHGMCSLLAADVLLEEVSCPFIRAVR